MARVAGRLRAAGIAPCIAVPLARFLPRPHPHTEGR